MAGDIVVSVAFDSILEAASPSLQNCIKFSSSGRYFSVLFDFGAVCICELKELGTGDNFKVALVKRLTYGKGELLEGHAWSSDDQIFAVAGCKIYLSNVCQGFSSLYSIPLYYMPKDISLNLSDCSPSHKAYSIAVAGPNGVELYQMEIVDNFKMGGFSSLHSDLAIAFVEFSPNKQYLAVAALDGHFGIWTVSSLGTDQKEFWYVHFKTVRITSIEFSPDSTMVAVVGWEGSWHLYRKVIQDLKLTWEEFHHGTSIDRVSGDLPGSFISWSPDNRFVRLTQCNDKTTCLSTFDTQTSVTTGIPLDGIVKGIASFRRKSADYTLCFLRSKQWFAVKWPQCHPAPSKITAAHEQETKILFEESLEGSLLVERSVESGVTLKWRRASRESLDLSRKLSKRGSEIIKLNGSHDQSSELQPDAANVRETMTDREMLKDKHESGSEQPQYSEGVLLRGDILAQDDDSLAECKQENIFIRSAEAGTNTTELNTDRSEADDQLRWDNDRRDEYKRLGEAHRTCSSSRESVKTHTLDSTENVSKNIRLASRLSNELLYIEVPFLNPRLFQKSGKDSLPPLSSRSVQLLISTNYVIVAILPLMAYVYHHKNEEWKSLLFPCAVDNCCITQDKYLVLLMSGGGLRIWCLLSMTMLYCSNEVVCGNKGDFARFIMSGHPFEPQCNIIKLDKTGAGEVLRISFQPNRGDPRVCVTSLPVCYPGLMSDSCASYWCGSIGQLIIFKEGKCPENGHQTKRSQDYEDVSLMKWVVIVPELHISRTFLEESKCSWEQFIFRHYSALYQLNNLALITP